MGRYSDFLAALKSSEYEAAKRILDEISDDSARDRILVGAAENVFDYANCLEVIEWLVKVDSALTSSEFLDRLMFFLFYAKRRHDSDENWFSVRVKALVLFARVSIEWNAKTSQVVAWNLNLGQIDCLFGKLLPSIDTRLHNSCLLSYARGLVSAVELKFCKEIMSCYCFGENNFDGRGPYLIDTWLVASNMRKSMIEKFPNCYRPNDAVSLDEFPSAFEIKDLEQLLEVVDRKDIQCLLTQWCLIEYRIYGWNIEIKSRFNYLEILRENSSFSHQLLSFCMSCMTKKSLRDCWMEVDDFCSAVLEIMPFCEENSTLESKVQQFIPACLDGIRHFLHSVYTSEDGCSVWKFFTFTLKVAEIGFSFVSQNTQMRSKLHSLFSVKFDFEYFYSHHDTEYFVEKTTLTHWVLMIDDFLMISSRVHAVHIHLLCGVDPHVKDGNGHTPLTSFLHTKSFLDAKSIELAPEEEYHEIVKLFSDHEYHFCINHNSQVNRIHEQLLSEYDFLPKVPVPRLECLAAKVVARWKSDSENNQHTVYQEIIGENRAIEIPQHLEKIVYRH